MTVIFLTRRPNDRFITAVNYWHRTPHHRTQVQAVDTFSLYIILWAGNALDTFKESCRYSILSSSAIDDKVILQLSIWSAFKLRNISIRCYVQWRIIREIVWGKLMSSVNPEMYILKKKMWLCIYRHYIQAAVIEIISRVKAIDSTIYTNVQWNDCLNPRRRTKMQIKIQS